MIVIDLKIMQELRAEIAHAFQRHKLDTDNLTSAGAIINFVSAVAEQIAVVCYSKGVRDGARFSPDRDVFPGPKS